MADTRQPPTLHPHLDNVNNLVTENPECLAQGSAQVRDAALAATKYLYDLSVESEKGSLAYINDLLGSLQPSQAPRTRSQIKRKRSPNPAIPVTLAPTPLDSLYTDDMEDNQIWAQLELRIKGMCGALSFILEENPEEAEELPSGSELDLEEEEEEEEDDTIESGEDSSSDEEEDSSLYSEDFEMGEDEVDGDEGELGLRDESEHSGDDDEPSIDVNVAKRTRGRTSRHAELDDDFFNLEKFNAETERAEAKSSSKGRLAEDDDSDFEGEEIDLFAPLVEDLSDEDDCELLQEPMYSDFFDPPSTTAGSKNSKGSSKRTSGSVHFSDSVKYKVMQQNIHSQSNEDGQSLFLEKVSRKRKFPALEDPGLSTEDLEDNFDTGGLGINDEGSDRGDNSSRSEDLSLPYEEIDAQATMQRFREDLFAEEEDGDDEGLSSHERRQAELQKQIAELEAENVGPKDWVLMGEANSRTRPQNSLLEEDLEFERATKVTPTITEEAVQSLEERIKARVIESRFDDVVRLRRVDDKPFLPSQSIELRDSKSTQSLGQLYENDYIAAQGGPLGDDRDGKLNKEHDEIGKLWEKLCGKLDALCNAHFTPKQPQTTIETIANVSTATLESALPTTKSATTLLAPEEVYAPLSSAPTARSEMTPAQKRAVRSKERKQKKKARDALERQLERDGNPRKPKGAKQDKQQALTSIVRAGRGVTVIGKNVRKKVERR